MKIGTDVRNINDGRVGLVTMDRGDDWVTVAWKGPDGRYKSGRRCKRYNIAAVNKRHTGELWAKKLAIANRLPIEMVRRILAEEESSNGTDAKTANH